MHSSFRITPGGWVRCFCVTASSAIVLSQCGIVGHAAPAAPPPIRTISLVLNAEASTVEQRIAGVLRDRIRGVTPVEVEIGSARKPGGDLYIHLGKVRDSGALNDLCSRESVHPPGKEKPNPEGFALKSIED